MPGSTTAMKGAGLAVTVVDGEADVRLAGPAGYSSDGRASLALPSTPIPAAEPGAGRDHSGAGGLTPPEDVLRHAFGRAGLYSGLNAAARSDQLGSARPGYDAAGRVSE
jgi:hypothetical protein